MQIYEKYEEAKDLINSVPGCTGDGQCQWVFDMVKGTSDDAWICEVGVYYGRMTAAMGLACLGSNRRVVSIDHMLGNFPDLEKGPPFCSYKDFIDNMIRIGVWHHIIPLPMKSFYRNRIPIRGDRRMTFDEIRASYLQGFEMLKVMEIHPAIIYLDGDHSEDVVYEELVLFTQMLILGGVICGDDCITGFTSLWKEGNLEHETAKIGVYKATWRFFREESSRFDLLESTPGNQFGFVKKE